jgi:hypothetical protein
MGFLDALRGADSAVDDLREENRQLADNTEFLQERLAELELALEDMNWTRLSIEGADEFSRAGLARIIQLCRIHYIKNPLINRSVELSRLYVFGQGVSIKAKNEDVNAVVQDFLEANRAEFSHQELGLKEVELGAAGNVFLALFPNISTGAVRVASIPVEEIDDIIMNPEYRKEPWYYKRVWTAAKFDTSSGRFDRDRQQTAYYPDWRYQPTGGARLKSIDGKPVLWESPVCHVKVGGFAHMRFGLPEAYSAIDWARAYKEFLENWFSLVKAYARFAWRRKVPQASAVAGAKAALGTTMSGGVDSNPPPLTGSTAIMAPGNDLDPIRTAGATTKAEDGRRGLLMVAAAMGLPETFYGDASVGTVATAKSLDRPTELKFSDRQTLWIDTLTALVDYAIEWARKAPSGPLRVGIPEEDLQTDVDFPPVVEGDIAAHLEAIVTGATLDGKALAGTMDMQTVARMVLSALGQDDIDELLDALPEPGTPAGEAVEAAMVETLRDLEEAVRELAGASA